MCLKYLILGLIFLPLVQILRAEEGNGIQPVPSLAGGVFEINEPRPLAALADLLERRTGVAISYEDPSYVYLDDLEDVTLKVRQDLDQYPPGKAPKVYIPRHVMFKADIPAFGMVKPLELIDSLSTLLKAYNNLNDQPGKFSMARTGLMLQIFPKELKSSGGQWRAVTPVLDSYITLKAGPRKLPEAIAEICSVLSNEVGVPVKPGVLTLPWDEVYVEAQNEPARDVLVRLLNEPSGSFSWRLLYDPSLKTYFLSINRVVMSKEDG